MDRTAAFYSQPSYVGAGAMPIFAGARRQRGGGILGSLKNIFMPILRNVGKRGAKAALGLASDVIGDVTSGKSFKTSIKQHGLRRAKRLGGDLLSSAVGQARQAITGTKPAPSRKRPIPPKTKRPLPPSAKRRKPNF